MATFQNSQLTKGRTVDIQALFNLADNYYSEVQGQLQRNIDRYSEKRPDSLTDNLILHCYTFQELYDLYRRHVVTVITSDRNSSEAKVAVVNRWLEFMRAEKWVDEAIEVGVNQDESMRHRNNAQSAFIGAMEAHGYNLQEEHKELEAKYKKYFGETQKSKVKKKKIASRVI